LSGKKSFAVPTLPYNKVGTTKTFFAKHFSNYVQIVALEKIGCSVQKNLSATAQK
jgi:hypothetical protein